ncbi:hypothetical protein FGE12_13850 [Aggregicoccus sp. 17bor-14]|uniref:hypothetical protein n=1 Tax=Myxococcaceae TaxID=31 RepID=UPI00129CBD8E|nr:MULTISPECIES: hypothetical protein [Myxococcaceae]MBF5043476.1 hypothetical protein [Simulacricoccus sp. 17bor-14]MRI89234.1 hypothetical protein [Aggregicoccus sp. 17bor-14]
MTTTPAPHLPVPGRDARPLQLLAALACVHLLAVALCLALSAPTTWIHECAYWLACAIGVVGTWRALGAFVPGDHLRRVWTLLAAGAVLLFVGTALRSYWYAVAGPTPFVQSPLLPWRTGVVVLANLVSTWALVLLAFTYQRAGLSPKMTWRSALAWAVGLALSLAVAVPQLRLDFAQLSAGEVSALSPITSIVSTLGDMLTILLIVPLLRVAYLMRGGRLARVWWVMGVSGAAWLVYDARAWLALLAPGHEAAALELLRVTRTVGLSAVGVAGWLQHAALAPHPAAKASDADVAAPAVLPGA